MHVCMARGRPPTGLTHGRQSRQFRRLSCQGYRDRRTDGEIQTDKLGEARVEPTGRAGGLASKPTKRGLLSTSVRSFFRHSKCSKTPRRHLCLVQLTRKNAAVSISRAISLENYLVILCSAVPLSTYLRLRTLSRLFE